MNRVAQFDDFDSDHSDKSLKTDASDEVPEEGGSANEIAPMVVNPINGELYVLYEPSDGLPYDTEIIFVHDQIYSEGCRDAWRTTWTNEDGVCWPREFLAKKFPSARILSVSYDLCVTTYGTQSTLDLVAENLMLNLFHQSSNVGQTPNCPVFFVGHGLGCFVIKKMIIKVDRYREYHQERKNSLLNNVGGFVFYSPFNFGVKWNLYEMESLAYNLIPHHPELSRLNDDFSKLRRDMQNHRESKLLWSVLTICDSHQTAAMSAYIRLEGTARFDCDSFLLGDGDHSHICKPRSTGQVGYRYVKEFIAEIVFICSRTDASSEVPEEGGSANEIASLVENRINDELFVLSEPSDGLPYDTEIIFVHDLYTEGCRDAWRTTWTNEDGVCWPKEFLAKKFTRARVLSVSYDACVTTNSTQGRMDSDIIAENLMHNLFLQKSNVGQTPNCKVFFVGHGLGCFVIKKLMVEVNRYREYHHRERRNRLLNNVGGFVFYSPFNFGVKWNMYEYESGQRNSLANFLEPHHPELSRLNDDFRKLRQHMKHRRKSKRLWSVLTICESHQTASITPGLQRKGTFVSEASAKHDCDLFRLGGGDHFNVCKPRSTGEAGYQFVEDFIANILEESDKLSRLRIFRYQMKIIPDQFRVVWVSIRRRQQERE